MEIENVTDRAIASRLAVCCCKSVDFVLTNKCVRPVVAPTYIRRGCVGEPCCNMSVKLIYDAWNPPQRSY